MPRADRRRRDEGRSVRDDGGDPASRSPWTERARTFSHHDPNPCQWFSRLAALDRRSTLRLILLLLGSALAGGWRTVTSRAGADGIPEGREAQPLGDHAAAGDRLNFDAENPGHGLTSDRPVLGSLAAPKDGLHRTHTSRARGARTTNHDSHPCPQPEGLSGRTLGLRAGFPALPPHGCRNLLRGGPFGSGFDGHPPLQPAGRRRRLSACAPVERTIPLPPRRAPGRAPGRVGARWPSDPRSAEAPGPRRRGASRPRLGLPPRPGQGGGGAPQLRLRAPAGCGSSLTRCGRRAGLASRPTPRARARLN
jgi:hypothetical protein